jgi:hypothetical protein
LFNECLSNRLISKERKSAKFRGKSRGLTYDKSEITGRASRVSKTAFFEGI